MRKLSSLEWIKSYGGSLASKVIYTSDEEILFVGKIKSATHCYCGSGYFLKKFDAKLASTFNVFVNKDGSHLKHHRFIDHASWVFNDAIETSRGDIIATGYIEQYDQELDIKSREYHSQYDGTYTLPIIVRYDKNWNLLWEVTINCTLFGSSYNINQGIKICDSGPEEFYVFSDDELIKIDLSGNVIWRGKPFLFSKIHAVLGDGIGGAYVAATYKSTERGRLVSSFTLLKIDANGEVLWESHFGGNTFSETVSSIIKPNEGEILILGSTWDKTGSFGFEAIEGISSSFLMSVSNTGNLNWLRKYSIRGDTTGISVAQYQDKYLLLLRDDAVLESTRWFGLVKPKEEPGADIVILITDKYGNSLNHVVYGGSIRDEPKNIAIDKQNNIYVAGDSNSRDGTFGNLHSCGRFSFVFKVDVNEILLF